jgi:hypothetical protein
MDFTAPTEELNGERGAKHNVISEVGKYGLNVVSVPIVHPPTDE